MGHFPRRSFQRAAPPLRPSLPRVPRPFRGIVPGATGALEENLRVFPLDRHPFVPLDLINNVGSDLNPGDVVAISPSDTNAVIVQSGPLTRQVCVVAQDVIPRGLPGRFCFQGETIVKASGTISLGEYVVGKSGSTAVQGTGRFRTGNIPNLTPPAGALGHAVEASSSGFVRCFWYGIPDSALTVIALEEFYEDFESSPAVFTGAGANEQWRYTWFRASGADSNASYGIMRVESDGATAGNFRLVGPGNVFATPFRTTNGPLVFETRFAQRGAAAATRRIGLSGTAITTTDPANGMFFRHALNGSIDAVCRAAGVESVLATGATAATDSFAAFAMAFDGNSTVTVTWTGAVVGTITSNIPTVALGPSGGVSIITLANGFDIDAIRVLQGR